MKDREYKIIMQISNPFMSIIFPVKWVLIKRNPMIPKIIATNCSHPINNFLLSFALVRLIASTIREMAVNIIPKKPNHRIQFMRISFENYDDLEKSLSCYSNLAEKGKVWKMDNFGGKIVFPYSSLVILYINGQVEILMLSRLL